MAALDCHATKVDAVLSKSFERLSKPTIGGQSDDLYKAIRALKTDRELWMEDKRQQEEFREDYMFWLCCA